MKQPSLVLLVLLAAALACNAPSIQGGASGSDTTDPNGEAATEAAVTGPSVEAARLIVYTCFVDGSDEVCLMNSDGSNQRQLTDSPATDWYPSLSPDGSTIVFSTRRDGQFELYTMDINGENLDRLTNKSGDNYSPTFSPDGTKIVYVSTTGGSQDVWVMNADGSQPVQVTTRQSEDLDPAWSPDASQIIFASNYTGTNELYVVNADGSNLRQVTADSGMREGGRSDWSPDGQYIAIYAGPQGEKNIFLIPVSCTNGEPCGPSKYTQVTQGGNAKAPSFSPDSQYIVYAAGPTKNNDVFIMLVDGTGIVQLTNGPLSEWQPRWGR